MTGQLSWCAGAKVRVQPQRRRRAGCHRSPRRHSRKRHGRELLRTVYSPAGHDGGADALGHPVWRARVSTLPVNDLPAVDYPVIQVQVNYPGATPETMANNVATPLERQFMQIPGLELVTSQQRAGPHQLRAAIRAVQEHRRGRDRRAGGDHAGARPAARRPAQPADVHQDQSERSADHVHRADQRQVTAGQLYDYANTQVGERISILPGVSQVQVYGTQSAVRIKADPSAMAVRGIDHRRSGRRHQATAPATPARASSTARTDLPAAAAGPA